MKKQVYLTFAVMLALVLSSIAPVNLYAGTVYVEKIITQYTIGSPNKWYDYIGPGEVGQINFTGTKFFGGLLNTHPAASPLYQFQLDGTLTFISQLKDDDSSGGRANGYFEGGATVILNGGIKHNGSFIYGGTGGAAQQILQATLDVVNEDPYNPTLDRWQLQEHQTDEGKFEKGLELVLTPASVGLASGIAVNVDGDNVLLKMLDPKMDLSLRHNSATNFLSDLGPNVLPNNVKFTAPIPEPGTMVLLGIGGLLLGYKKK